MSMYPRVNYEMTEKDLNELLEVCRPTPVMKIGSYIPASPQENANRAWRALGEKMGFDSMTVQPIPGKGDRFFSAVPTETESQREERLKREAADKRKQEIEVLRHEIAQAQEKLQKLEAEDGNHMHKM